MAGRKVEVADYGVVTFDRETFVREVFDYHPGEHVTVLAPSGGGKTQLAYQLLGQTAKPGLQATVLVMKPCDTTVVRFTKQFGFKIVRDWPPSRITGLGSKKPPGYVLWPKETSGDPDFDNHRHGLIFRRAIREAYSKGNKIIFADETYSLEKEMVIHESGRAQTLTPDLVRVWTKGRSMECGLWAASQRPVWISKWAYQAHHLFLGNDPDVDTQKRYGDIGGGIDPDLVRSLTAKLERYEFIYIHREERQICIVGA